MIEKRNLQKSSLQYILLDWAMWFALVAICVTFGIVEPRFRTSANLWNVLRQASLHGLGAVGMGTVLIGGGFDMSVGATAAMVSVVMVYGVWMFGTIPGILLGLLTGAVIGIFNGVVITKWRLNPFIMTLGTMTALQGLAFIVTGGEPLTGNIPKSMLIIGSGYVGPVPIPVIIFTAGFLAAHFILSKTVLGRNIYAIGGNREVARLAGINLLSTTVWRHVLCSLFAAVVGVMMCSRLGIGTGNMGQTLTFDSFGAAVIGGVSFYGGQGNMLGVLLGILLLSIIRNGLNLYNVSPFVQMMATGLIILVAITIDRYRYRGIG